MTGNWDFRHWIASALFVQSSGLFLAIMFNPGLADNQGFMVLATAVIVTGWVGGAVAFAFAAGIESSRNSSAMNKALDLAKDAGANNGPSGNKGDPVHTVEESK